MCGILGTVNIRLHKKDLDLLKHRGSDDFKPVPRLKFRGYTQNNGEI